ncbi:MAG: hypothetical protein ABJH63_15200 [Rhizobiaceae bacterium]
MKTFEGLVQIDNRLLRVQVQAQDPLAAKQMLEAQYPNGKLQGLPLEKLN